MGILEDRKREKRIKRIITEYLDGDISSKRYLKKCCEDDDIWERVETLLKEMSQVRAELDNLNRYFCLENNSLWDIPFPYPLPPFNERFIIESLPQQKKCSLWLHTELKKDIIIPPGANHHEFFMDRIDRVKGEAGERLLVIAHNKIILEIAGHRRLLDYLEFILANCYRWTEHEILHGIILPSSLNDLELQVRDTIKRVQIFRERGDFLRRMVYELLAADY
ncbi:MAG: hypothetical protein ACE5EA_10915 [Nitrospirota bacterium]